MCFTEFHHFFCFPTPLCICVGVGAGGLSEVTVCLCVLDCKWTSIECCVVTGGAVKADKTQSAIFTII